VYRNTFYLVSAAAFCLAVPASVLARSWDGSRALTCGGGDNPICKLYRICRPVLDKYPESEITEEGKDCALTINSRQIIIRRKRVGDDIGYFFYWKILPAGKVCAR
jgi:hypothetical protein